ncbi:carbohydrate kinase [Aquibacillus koreensis]|uniref:Carbohydrate kinase n=1 Tax=Aquibacillus koreensis TaxID=279446 RepID=A0A9X3WQ41_9BACI|nr:carbohydrate kinase [Aquibacillus koreensis]MCT2536713.1 carbohydrate kinase [Aquibacillus koreensis]MDC3421531.1 carbohydrate kinase [Aquibacillus koreensis]
MLEFDSKIQFKKKENDVLTLGEILIDMISVDYDDNFECDTYQRYFGGSPANIAINVKNLGINSAVSSAVGNDGFGNFLINSLLKNGVDIESVQNVNYATSLVMVTKSKSTPTPIFYRSADYHLQYTTKLEKTLLKSRIIHFSCWPISREPARSTIEKVIEVAKVNQVLVGFDPNFHPMIWSEGEDGIDYVKAIIKNVDVVKPSEDDAERLFGKDTPENQLKKFLQLGANLVILTLGKNGAIVSNGKETIRFNTLAKEVVDTTGAGDAFWSGFYTGLIKGHTIRESLALGFGVSAFKLKYTGAVINLPKIERIKTIYNLQEGLEKNGS